MLLNLVLYVGGLIVLIFTVLPSSPAGIKYDPIPAASPDDNPYRPQNPYPPQSPYSPQNTYPPQSTYSPQN